jgi:hypothetical protein
MMRKVLFLFILIVSLLPADILAQKLDSMMQIYSEKFPQEKVYLQFDKNAYNPGERIWFKAYLFTGFDPSPYSKNLYTEIYDAYGNLIVRNASPIKESMASGSMDLPLKFQGTRIRIRAFTSWMLNFDTSFVYSKDFRVTGTQNDSSSSVTPPVTTLRFFPEGGDIIAGTENVVAFKAEDNYGQPHKISGIIYDQTGKSLLDLSTVHDGMGKFLLAPEKADIFYALWKDESGIEHKTELPQVKTEGAALRLIYSKRKLIFSVSRPAESLSNQQVVVIAHMNQQMIYKAVVSLKESRMSGGEIPTQQLPSGTLQVTVFDMNQNPLAERIIFVNNNNYDFETKLTIVSKGLAKRGRNVFEIELPDTIKSYVSLAVTDAEVDGHKTWQDNIITRLLLTGDLRGYIKDPYYYFRNDSDSLTQQLDLVMLTHGWRRFNWQMLGSGRLPVIRYPIENYLSVNAEVLGVDKSRIAKDETISVILQSKDSTNKLLEVPRLSNGKFDLPGLIFYDTAKAYYQFTINKNLSQEAAVIFKNGLFVSPKTMHPFAMTMPIWSADDTSLIRKNHIVQVEIAKLRDLNVNNMQNLEVVTVRARVKSQKQKLDEEYSSGLFSGGDAAIFDLTNDQASLGYLDIFSYLQGRVAGLQISTVGQTPSMTWRGSTPTLYLNEMPIRTEDLQNIPVTDIAMIKIFNPGTGGFSGGGGGTIAVYTKKGSDRPPDPTIKGLEMSRIPGYGPVRQFYSPDYLHYPDATEDDIRTTLYWNPNIQTSKGNFKFTIPFFNSDVTHHIRIVLEGIDDEGKLTHVEKLIE